MSSPPAQAVLFDLDGTLLDSLGDLADAMNTVLSKEGLPTHDLDAFRYHIGDGIRALVERSLPAHLHDDASLDRFLELYRASYAERWHLSQPFPGVPELLDALSSRGIAIGVVSNKPDPFTQQCVRQLFPHWQWNGILGQTDAIPAKPDPTGAVRMAETIGLPVDACWFVGDSDVDMQTGVRAGMHPVGVTWGFRPAEELRAAGAKHLIEEPKDLLTLLDTAAS